MTNSSFQESYLFENLRKVITIIDKLRDLNLHRYISLPRIAVLGTQSSGKSSLLEQIVGLDFLPRGEGVVTRRPLELRLVSVSKEQYPKPVAKFDELKDQQFSDFNEVKRQIEILTDKVAGSNKGIVDIPIILTVYSPTCPDLTLIDLPGITRIPLKGSDQTQDIEAMTKKMVTRYCEDPQTIIMAVIPANADLSTSDALLTARKLDPEGDRTIGVFTKIDIMDRGTDARKMLLGEEISLKYGFIGVKCRSQQDINQKVTVQQALENERMFFANNPIYSVLPSGHTGTESLTQKLTEQLYKHIREFLPKLMEQMSLEIDSKEARLKEIGPGLPASRAEKMKFLWLIINDFLSQYNANIDGNYERGQIQQETDVKKNVSIQILDLLHDVYDDQVAQQICDKYTDEDIKRAMDRHEGETIPGFPSFDSFLALLIPQLQLLRAPVVEAINELYTILEDSATKVLGKAVLKIPDLKPYLQTEIWSVLQNERDATRELIINIIESEINYIFTNNSEYYTSTELSQKKHKVDPQSGRGNLIAELRSKINHYYSIAVKALRDTLPKLIGTFLVKASQEKLKNRLYEIVTKAEAIFETIIESSSVAKEREELQNGISTIKEAQKLILRDPDLARYAHRGISKEDIAGASILTNKKNKVTADTGKGKQDISGTKGKNLVDSSKPSSMTKNSENIDSENRSVKGPTSPTNKGSTTAADAQAKGTVQVEKAPATPSTTQKDKLDKLFGVPVAPIQKPKTPSSTPGLPGENQPQSGYSKQESSGQAKGNPSEPFQPIKNWPAEPPQPAKPQAQNVPWGNQPSNWPNYRDQPSADPMAGPPAQQQANWPFGANPQGQPQQPKSSADAKFVPPPPKEQKKSSNLFGQILGGK